MNRGEAREKLSAYLEGDLSSAETAELELMLKQDNELAAELEELRSTITLLRELPEEDVPAGFYTDLTERIEHRSAFSLKAAFDSLFTYSPVRLAAGFAIIFIFVGVSLYNLDPQPDSGRDESIARIQPKEKIPESLALEQGIKDETAVSGGPEILEMQDPPPVLGGEDYVKDGKTYYKGTPRPVEDVADEEVKASGSARGALEESGIAGGRRNDNVLMNVAEKKESAAALEYTPPGYMGFNTEKMRAEVVSSDSAAEPEIDYVFIQEMKKDGLEREVSPEQLPRLRTMDTAPAMKAAEGQRADKFAATRSFNAETGSRPTVSKRVLPVNEYVNEGLYSFTDRQGEGRQVVIGFVEAAENEAVSSGIKAKRTSYDIDENIGEDRETRLITGDLTDAQKLALRKLASRKIGSPFLERYVAAQYMKENADSNLKIKSAQEAYSPEQPVKLIYGVTLFDYISREEDFPFIIQIDRNGEIIWVQAFSDVYERSENDEFGKTENIQQWLKKDLKGIAVSPDTFQARIIILTDPPLISQPTSFRITSDRR